MSRIVIVMKLHIVFFALARTISPHMKTKSVIIKANLTFLSKRVSCRHFNIYVTNETRLCYMSLCQKLKRNFAFQPVAPLEVTGYKTLPVIIVCVN
jgi:hypothetical protein